MNFPILTQGRHHVNDTEFHCLLRIQRIERQMKVIEDKMYKHLDDLSWVFKMIISNQFLIGGRIKLSDSSRQDIDKNMLENL